MIRVIPGDCRAILPALAEASVQCVVTSPPYFGLRSYLADGHCDKATEIGAETSPEAYVATMVAVFREVRRVLRDDGVAWLNLGDSYSGNPSSGGANRNDGGPAVRLDAMRAKPGKPKDLLMIPARVALALQADGWWLRSDIIWSKPNPMPESVTDRPTSAHEHVFMLTKRARYFYDAQAVSEPSVIGEGAVRNITPGNKGSDCSRNDSDRFGVVNNGFRNLRNVWTIATQPYPGSHFATMPPELAERCIKAGSRPGDTVLDPFAGAGTTLLVADRLQRDAIGIDLNATYAELAVSRIATDAGMFADIDAQPVAEPADERAIRDLFAVAAE